MPQIETPTISDAVSTPNTDDTFEFSDIGIEFEYPVGDGTPSDASRSNELLQTIGRGNEWDLPENVQQQVAPGQMTGDHVGAEITSDILDLHSDAPERWYVETIKHAEDMGYPFARTGYGDTVFGLHMHLSSLPEESARALYEMCQEPWMKVFVCSSISETSLDPWRHGGVGTNYINGSRNFDGRQYCVSHRDYGADDHYEWRLPEPMYADHFMAVMHFLRTLAIDGPSEAEEYAHGLVESADPRLSAVKHYNYLSETNDSFPREEAVREDNQTMRSTAEYFNEIMQ